MVVGFGIVAVVQSDRCGGVSVHRVAGIRLRGADGLRVMVSITCLEFAYTGSQGDEERRDGFVPDVGLPRISSPQGSIR